MRNMFSKPSMAPRAAARERTQELMGQPAMPSMAIGMRFAPSGEADATPAEEPASTPAQIQEGRARDAMGLVALGKAVRGTFSAPVGEGALGSIEAVLLTDDSDNIVLQEVIGDNRTLRFPRADFCRLNPSADLCAAVAPKVVATTPVVVVTDAAVKAAATATKTKPMSSAPLTVGPSIPEMKVSEPAPAPAPAQTQVITSAITAEESSAAIRAQAVALAEAQAARDSYAWQRNLFIVTTVLGAAATGGTYWYLTKGKY